MEQYLWQILFAIVSTAFLALVGITGWFLKSTITELKTNLTDIKAQLNYLVEQKDFDGLSTKVGDHQDRLIRLETKIQSCKACNA